MVNCLAQNFCFCFCYYYHYYLMKRSLLDWFKLKSREQFDVDDEIRLDDYVVLFSILLLKRFVVHKL